MSRDSQKQRVYNAEHALQTMYDRTLESGHPSVIIDGISLVLPPEARFGSLDSIQAYVNRVMAMPSVVAQLGQDVPPAITVRERKGHSAAHYEGYGPHGGTIAVHTGKKNWAMRELVVLHEMAHHFSRSSDTAHGPEFADALITLLELVMGPQAALALRLIFDQCGVDARPRVAS